MKIEILQEELLAGVGVVIKAVSPRTQLPILSAIKMEASNTGLVLTGTDLEIGIVRRVGAKVETEGIVAVPAKMFAEILSTLSPGKLFLELKDGNLIIKASGFSGKLAVMESSDYPSLPSSLEGGAAIVGKKFSESIESVVFASARDSLRPVLTGVLMDIGKSLKMVATDGFRLAVDTLGIESGESVGRSVLIPGRAAGEVSKIFKESDLRVGYLEDTRQAVFADEQTILVSQVIEGNFPDYQKILPKEFTTELTIPRADLLSAVKKVAVFARENSSMMKWKIEGGVLLVTASSASLGECEVVVDAKIEGDDLEVVFNTKYVMDYLLLPGEESVWVGLGGKLAPGMMRNLKSKDRFYVVMPINA